MTNNDKATAGDDRIDAAAARVVRAHSDQAVRADAVETEAWLADPANAREYARQQALWDRVGRLGADAAARDLLMRSDPAPQWKPSRRVVLGLAGSAAAAAAAFTLRAPVPEGDTYRTQRGEQRTVSLADGSTMVLNTDSQAVVLLTPRQRLVFLERGQGFFTVAKDAARPFRVFADGHEVRALGTAFDVFRNGASTRVILEEGSVALYRDQVPAAHPAQVRSPNPGTPAAVLTPGQQAVMAAAAPVSVMKADVSAAEAWREGRIVFDETPLGDAIKDVNRYQQRQILLGATVPAGLAVSGVFHTNHLDAFVEALVETFPLRVAQETAGEVVLAER